MKLNTLLIINAALILLYAVDALCVPPTMPTMLSMTPNVGAQLKI